MFQSYFHPTLVLAMRPFRLYVPGVIFLGLLGTALEGIGIGLVIPLLDVVMSDNSSVQGWMPGLLASFGQGIPSENRGLFIGLSILVLVVLKNLVAYANGLLQAWIYGKSGHALRDQLSRKMVEMHASYYLTQPPSRLLNVISSESWRTSDAVGACLSILVSGAAALIFLTFLFFLSPQLTIVVLVGIALIQFAHDRLSSHFSRLGREITTQNRGLALRMLHHITAWRLIRLFHREEFEIQRFADASERVRQVALNLVRRQIAVGPLTEVAHATLFMLVIYAAWALGTSFGTAAAFIILLYRLQPQVRQIQGALSSLRGWNGSLDEVHWLLTARPSPANPPDALPSPEINEGISFRNVSYSYTVEGQRTAALTDVSFDVPAGTSVAIIGRSGSGKSTIANLICGIIDPSEGEILVDGVRLDRIERTSWLSRIAMASQELELFDGTIAENILYGEPDARFDQARAAAVAADADDFISRLPNGYETVVGDRGLNLSAGQRQRIALARALMRNPRLLILDEATNAMDILSEAVALKILATRRTSGATILISHHLSSIRLCDRYIRISEGRVIEAGSTAEFDETSLADILSAEGQD